MKHRDNKEVLLKRIYPLQQIFRTLNFFMLNQKNLNFYDFNFLILVLKSDQN